MARSLPGTLKLERAWEAIARVAEALKSFKTLSKSKTLSLFMGSNDERATSTVRLCIPHYPKHPSGVNFTRHLSLLGATFGLRSIMAISRVTRAEGISAIEHSPSDLLRYEGFVAQVSTGPRSYPDFVWNKVWYHHMVFTMWTYLFSHITRPSLRLEVIVILSIFTYIHNKVHTYVFCSIRLANIFVFKYTKVYISTVQTGKQPSTNTNWKRCKPTMSNIYHMRYITNQPYIKADRYYHTYVPWNGVQLCQEVVEL